MKTIYFATAGLLLILSLSGCTADKVQTALTTGCAIANVGSMRFDDYVSAHPGRIDVKGIAWKNLAMGRITDVCAHPEAVTGQNMAATLELVANTGFALYDFITEIDKAPAP